MNLNEFQWFSGVLDNKYSIKISVLFGQWRRQDLRIGWAPRLPQTDFSSANRLEGA